MERKAKKANDLGNWVTLPHRVEVEWVDSQSRVRTWVNVDDVVDESHDEVFDGIRCVSVGFVLRRTRKVLQLASGLSASAQAAHVMTIPRCAITKITRLGPHQDG